MSDEVNFLASLEQKGSDAGNTKGKKQKSGETRRAVTVNLATKEIMKEAAKRIGRKSVRTIVISTIASLALAALSYGGVLIYGQMQKRTFDIVTRPLDDINKEIASLESKSKELIAFQSKLIAIKSLLDEHVYMSDIFKKIENVTLPEVSYTSISIAPNMTVSINGIASNYTTLGRQLLSYNRAKEFISNAEISSASAVLGSSGQISGVNFDMNLTLQKEAVKRAGIK